MKFVGGLLVSSLLAMGLSACTYSDGEWTRNRAPSREAAARADDKEAECRDPWLFDFDAEDRAGNRSEQMVFALELNEDADSNGEDGASAKCKVSLDEIDWTSITAVEAFFAAIIEEMPERVITENVSNTVKIDPIIKKDNEYEDWSPMDDELFQYFANKYWDTGPLGRHRGLNCTKPPDTTDWRPYCGDFFNADDPAIPHETLSWTRENIVSASWDSSQVEQTLQPNAAVLPSHDWQGFYQDQHLMTFGVCDAVDEEAIVFFFDPNFTDGKYEYHKVWSEGSTVTQRSLPAPRFRFPFKAEDALQQPESIGIKIVDGATKQPVGAALVEVFVTQVKTKAGKPTTEAGKETEDLYGCKFDLKITRTYEKQSLPKRWFKSEIQKAKVTTAGSSKWAPSLAYDHGAKVWLVCFFPDKSTTPTVRFRFHLTDGSDRSLWFPSTISVATNTTAESYDWYPSVLYSEEIDEPFNYGKNEGSWATDSTASFWGSKSLKLDNPIEEVLLTVSRGNGDLYSRHYYWIQSDSNWDPSNKEGECRFKVNGLKMLFVDIEKIEAWISADTTWSYGQKYKDGPKFWIEFFDS